MPFGTNDAVYTPAASGGGFGASDPAFGASQPTGHQAQDIGDALIAGLQASSTGLMVRGKLPDVMLGNDAPWYMRAASAVGGMAGDIPEMVAGGVAGGTAGSAVPVVGTVAGATIGAFAVPQAIREALTTAYGHNLAPGWDGVWEIAKSAIWGGAKGAFVGGVTHGAGALAEPLVAGVAGKAVLGGTITPTVARVGTDVATISAQIAAMTTASSAIAGHLPTARDFVDNAILLGGAKFALGVARNMRNVYAETGKAPDAQLAEAMKDPALKQAYMDMNGPELPPQFGPEAINARIESALAGDARPEAMLKSFLNQKEPPKLDQPIPGDPVRYEYIADNETAAGVLKGVTKLYQDQIDQQSGRVQTDKATALMGLRMVHDGDVAPHVLGEGASAAEIFARAHLLRGAANDVTVQMRKLANADPATLSPIDKLQALASIERLAMLRRDVEGAGAEVGRALHTFRTIKRDPSYLGDADNILKLAQQKGDLQDIAKMFVSLKDSAQLGRFAEDYLKATTKEKVLEAWKAGILTGPWTHLSNILGNVTKWITEVPEDIISAMITAAQRKLAGDPLTAAQYKARAFAQLKGIQLGALDGLKVGGEILRGQGAHMEKQDVYREAIQGKWFVPIRMASFRALSAEDAVFRTIGERAQAYVMAVDRIVAEGLHPDTAEGQAAIMRYVVNPEAGLNAEAGAAAIAKVQQAGAEAVFSQRLGPRLERIQSAIQGTWYSMAVPFIRTPANLVSWAVQHIPGMNFMSERWRNDYAAGGEARARALTRVSVGGALMLSTFAMADAGMITGGGLYDPQQRRTKMAAGWQPYSFLIDGKYYSYQRIEPVSHVLGLAADLVEMWHARQDEADRAKIFAMGVLAFGNATVSTTYLSGLSNTMNAVTDPDRYLPTLMNQYATSLVPKAIGQIATMTDPHKREVDGVLDAVQSQIPFLREKLLPKRDVWGEPVAENHWFKVMPITATEASKDKVRTEAARLQLAIADAPRFLTEKGPFKPSERQVALTPEQRDIFREQAGKNAMTLLAPIVNAPDWNSIPDYAKAAIYKDILAKTRKGAQYAALPAGDAARAKLREEIVNKIIQQQQSAEGAQK